DEIKKKYSPANQALKCLEGANNRWWIFAVNFLYMNCLPLSMPSMQWLTPVVGWAFVAMAVNIYVSWKGSRKTVGGDFKERVLSIFRRRAPAPAVARPPATMPAASESPAEGPRRDRPLAGLSAVSHEGAGQLRGLDRLLPPFLTVNDFYAMQYAPDFGTYEKRIEHLRLVKQRVRALEALLLTMAAGSRIYDELDIPEIFRPESIVLLCESAVSSIESLEVPIDPGQGPRRQILNEIQAEILSYVNLTFSLVEDLLIYIGYNYGKLKDGSNYSPPAAAWLKDMVENRYVLLYRIYEINQRLIYLVERICMPARDGDGNPEKDVRDVDLTEHVAMSLVYDTADLEGPGSVRFVHGVSLRRDLGYERVLLERISFDGVKKICGELRKNALCNFYLGKEPLDMKEEPFINVKLRMTEGQKAVLTFENNCVAGPVNPAALMLMALPGYSLKRATQESRIEDRHRQLLPPEPGGAGHAETGPSFDPIYGGFGFGLAKLFHEAAVAGASVEVYVKGEDGRTYLMTLDRGRIPYVRETSSTMIRTKTGFKVIVTFPRAKVLPGVETIPDDVVRAAGSYPDAHTVKNLLFVALYGERSVGAIIDMVRETRMGVARIGELDFTRLIRISSHEFRLPFETETGRRKVLVAGIPGPADIAGSAAVSGQRIRMEIRDRDNSPRSSPQGNAIAAVISAAGTVMALAMALYAFQT
ncbi:MAG: hypothetical protein ABH885_08565, partial [Candidatus Omnitrophota bacterium]